MDNQIYDEENSSEKRSTIDPSTYCFQAPAEFISCEVNANDGQEKDLDWYREDLNIINSKFYEFLEPDSLQVHKPLKGEESLNRFQSYVGQDDIKNQVSQIIKRMKFERMRQEVGSKENKFSNHMVFSGNPGTAKTEIARLLGGILREEKILSSGHVVEVDRSDLIMGWIGQSAIKTKEIIDYAQGGILFIDEAYSLDDGTTQDFGPEVTATLMKAMEDYRENFIVIMAGYKDEMKALLKTNPGFKSRIRHQLDFKDYSEKELMEIFYKFCSDNDYHLDESATHLLKTIFSKTKKMNKTYFGNGRFVRNIFQKTLDNLACRVVDLDLKDEGDLHKILFSDIPKIEDVIDDVNLLKSIS